MRTNCGLTALQYKIQSCLLPDDAYNSTNTKKLEAIVKSCNFEKIKWLKGDFAHGCQFVDGEIAVTTSPKYDCVFVCHFMPGCTHYTWSSENGGLCWLGGANGVVKKSQAVMTKDLSTLCGVVNVDLVVEGCLMYGDLSDDYPNNRQQSLRPKAFEFFIKSTPLKLNQMSYGILF